MDGPVQQCRELRHLRAPADQFRLSTPRGQWLVTDAQQLVGGHRLPGALDPNVFEFAHPGRARHQSRRRRAQHHRTRRGHRLHPLRNTYLLTDGGIAEPPCADPTGDHLTGVHTHPQLQFHSVPLVHADGEPLDLPLDVQGGPTGSNGVVFQSHRRPEHRHDPVAGPLGHSAAVSLHHRRTTVGEFGHDFA
ncbi:hypothetical protein IWGMT90018_11230 [Mycobacterium kiyosense]|nr:hypothetical protein IWGMT90018_11230 [Mycobacterium kiyosense]